MVIALIIITVVALVTVSVLALANTGMRTTVALRAQASVQYQASNVINQAIEQLRTVDSSKLTLGCGPAPQSPQSTTYPVDVIDNQSYPAAGTAPGGYASVTCQIDSSHWQSGFITDPNAGPGTALLALGDSSDASNGIHTHNVKSDLLVGGGVFSNTVVDHTDNSNKGDLVNTWSRPAGAKQTDMSWIIGRTGVSAGASTCADTRAANPSQVQNDCSYGSQPDVRGMDPGTLVEDGTTSYNQEDPGTRRSFMIGTCRVVQDAAVVTVGPTTFGWVDMPGTNELNQDLADKFADSSSPCSDGGGNGTGKGKGKGNKLPQVVQFSPGIYVLSSSWTIPSYPIVGGKLSDAGLYSGTDLESWISDFVSGSTGTSPCVDPLQATDTRSGVEFYVKGGGAIDLNVKDESAVMCASASAAGPPMIVYSPRGTGGNSAISMGNKKNVQVNLLGTVYTPSRPLSVQFNNNSQSSFAYGMIALSLNITATGSAATGIRLAGGLPQGGGSPVPVNYMVLKAYVCPNSNPDDPIAGCSSTGDPRLTVKVAISGYVDRSVSIIGWTPTT